MKKLFPFLSLWTGLLLLGACAGNPLSFAKTTEQRAWALYGTYVVHQEQAAALVQNPAVPEDVKARIRAADKVAHPIAEALFESASAVIETRRLVEAGSLPPEELAAANRKLSEAYVSAAQALVTVINMVKEAK